MNQANFESDSGKWNGETSRLLTQFIHPTSTLSGNRVSFKEFERLPEAVSRYFRFALKEGQPPLDAVRITQSGEIKAGWWCPFTAEQYFSIHSPGFVWDANVRTGPWITMKVRDTYLQGKGSMEARLFGVLPFLHSRDADEINQAALQRYLAESIWFPTALLPSDRLSWQAIGRNRALAKLKDREIEASMEFQFNDGGEIVEIFSPGRYRYAGGKFVLTMWRGAVRAYEEVKGIRVPMKVEIDWILPEGRCPYFKSNIEKIEFNENALKHFSFGSSCCGEGVCS